MKVVFLFFLLIPFNIFSQKIIICDSITKKGIPFVNIITEKEGFYSDLNGIAIINNETKNFSLSHVAYNSKKIKLNRIIDTIFLIEKMYHLNDVVISPKEKKTFRIGYNKKDNRISSIPLKPKNELVLEINPIIEYDNLIIEQIEIPINKIKHYNKSDKKIKNKSAFFRINIYINNNNQLELKYQSNYKSFIMSERESISFNLEDDELIINEKKFYISIEMIGNIDENGIFVNDESYIRPIITSDEDKSYKSNTYIKSTFNNNILEMTNINEFNKYLSSDLKSYSEKKLNLAIGLTISVK